jgi:prepilin-type N-terminal cleavage/methylation domain-containing protein
MKQNGFTLVEVLTTVVIIAVLASIALPMYTRSVERSRAMEAMSSIKAMNDSIYAYFTEHESCPTNFGQLVMTVPYEGDAPGTTINAKYFAFVLGGAPAAVPGTDDQCMGVLAQRLNGGRYQYVIWNPYTRAASGTSLSLQCAPLEEEGSDVAKSRAVCESLGLFRAE